MRSMLGLGVLALVTGCADCGGTIPAPVVQGVDAGICVIEGYNSAVAGCIADGGQIDAACYALAVASLALKCGLSQADAGRIINAHLAAEAQDNYALRSH